MKKKGKFLKVFALIGGIILIAGIAMFSVGMNRIDWDFRKLDREELTAAEFASANQIDKLTLNGNWDFEIVRGEQFKVSYYTSNIADIVLEEAVNNETGKSTFIFTEEREHSRFPFGWIGFNGLARVDLKVVITVTEDVAIDATGSSVSLNAENQNFLSVAVNGSSAGIDFNGVSVDGDINVQGSAMDADLDGVTAKNVVIKSSSGDLDIVDCNFENVSVDGSAFDVEIEGSAIEEKFSIESSSGEVDMVNSSAKDIYAKGSSIDFRGDYIDIRTFTGFGSSLEVEIKLVGQKSDVLSATAQGSHAVARIDGEKGNYNGSGFKTFSAQGSSVELVLNFKGGQSIFTE